MEAKPPIYRGRFAPSPSGELHFGSLVAALGSWLCARQAGGVWLIRVEDLDPPREIPGAAQQIIDTLAAFGMQSDEPILYQSQRLPLYAAALARLKQSQHAFGCRCTRSALKEAGLHLGRCSSGSAQPLSWRVEAPDEVITFTDLLQGEQRQHLRERVGDFIVKRADGLFAYQLAVVVDDAAQGITQVVRGADLLDSTPRQLYLQRCLGLPSPSYAHLPLAVDARGVKLSKQLLSSPIDPKDPLPALRQALAFLGQDPAKEHRDPRALLSAAARRFSLGDIPKVASRFA